MKSGCTKSEEKGTRSIKLPVVGTSPAQAAPISTSKASRWRAIALITLNLLMIGHVIQWRITGTTVSPIEPSETMYTLQRGAINAGLIFFSLAILATLIVGRFVCGWGCHIVALQDFCAWLMKKIGITPRPFRSRLLVYVPLIAALYMFVWPTALRAITKPSDERLIPEFTNHLVTENFWATFPTVGVAIPFLFVCGFMTVYFLGSKGFCTYACPYGGFFSIADKFAPGRIRVTNACNECGHCTATCTSNVLVHKEVKEFGMVVDPGCMKCMDCVSVCPNDALYFGFGKPSIGLGLNVQTKKSYSLTWTEEIVGVFVFLFSYLAVWDVYQLVPMLMALGWATVTTFLVLKSWQLFNTRDVAFHRFGLRSTGKFKSLGVVFLAFSAIWTTVTVHSGWIRYHEFSGNRAFQRVQVPDELALAEANPDQWLSPNDRENIATGKRHFESAAKVGFVTNVYTQPKLGWLTYLSGDAEEAVKLLNQSAQSQQGQPKALSLYYRGAILNRLRRHEEAIKSLDGAMTERPDLILAWEEKGEAEWHLGRKDLAVSSWLEALKANPNLILANNFLAGALSAMNKSDEAAFYKQRLEQLTPNNPHYHWVLGLRLQNLGMNELAEKHFQQAIKLDPAFQLRRMRRK